LSIELTNSLPLATQREAVFVPSVDGSHSIGIILEADNKQVKRGVNRYFSHERILQNKRKRMLSFQLLTAGS